MHKINTDVYNYKYKIMSSLLNYIEKDASMPVILCIGSSNTTGDCLGPLTGNLLIHKYNIRTYVYGTLNRPVTSANVTQVCNFIKKNHYGKIIAVDAALGNDANTVTVYNGGIIPAAAVNKRLPSVGDYSVTANVNFCGAHNIKMLQSVSTEKIKALADSIAFGINDAVMLYRAYKKTN